MDELKPYFASRIREIYGDVGVGGWRNRSSGAFEFSEEAWRQLCGLCEQGTTDQKAAGRKLLAALDGAAHEPDMSSRRSSGRRRRSSFIGGIMGGDDDLDDESYLARRRDGVLSALWKKKDQKEGRMWHASSARAGGTKPRGAFKVQSGVERACS